MADTLPVLRRCPADYMARLANRRPFITLHYALYRNDQRREFFHAAAIYSIYGSNVCFFVGFNVRTDR